MQGVSEIVLNPNMGDEAKQAKIELITKKPEDGEPSLVGEPHDSMGHEKKSDGDANQTPSESLRDSMSPEEKFKATIDIYLDNISKLSEKDQQLEKTSGLRLRKDLLQCFNECIQDAANNGIYEPSLKHDLAVDAMEAAREKVESHPYSAFADDMRYIISRSPIKEYYKPDKKLEDMLRKTWITIYYLNKIQKLYEKTWKIRKDIKAYNNSETNISLYKIRRKVINLHKKSKDYEKYFYSLPSRENYVEFKRKVEYNIWCIANVRYKKRKQYKQLQQLRDEIEGFQLENKQESKKHLKHLSMKVEGFSELPLQRPSEKSAPHSVYAKVLGGLWRTVRNFGKSGVKDSQRLSQAIANKEFIIKWKEQNSSIITGKSE